MHARVQTVEALPSVPVAQAQARTIVDVVAGHPGFQGIYLLRPLGTARGVMLTLWATDEDARMASERTAAVRGPRPFTLHSDETYLVEDDWSGAAAGAGPTVAGVLSFGGPISPVMHEAATRAGRDRIAPALRAMRGLVRTLALWQPQTRSALVVNFGTSIEALDAAGQAVNATELLPGEDPALLPGPDRADLHEVVAQSTSPLEGTRR
jgi:hypothetical protein